MLDLKFIRDHADEVRAGLRKLHAEAPIDDLLAADERRRALLTEVEQLKQQLNERSRQVARATPEERPTIIAENRQLGERIGELDGQVREVEERLNDLLLQVPNMPHPDVPAGDSEDDNVVVRTWGEPRDLGFPARPHWDLGPALGIIDFDRGVKISGTRFYLLRGQGARLQRALITFMLDVHTQHHGYTEVYPPYMVKGECMVGTGQLPKFADNLYRDIEEDFWFVPTAEVPVTNMFRDEVLPAESLPLNHCAYTACFRREKMSAGRDVRGIKRGHQFDKVELVKVVHPDTSMQELAKLMSDAEDILQRLELPYRVVQMCTADLSFTAAAKYDLELWAAGSQEWLEVSSCSNFLDFQARRAGIRFKETGGKPRFAHTLNGSGLALPRTLIAVLENYQREDGTIVIPAALRPYMGGQEIITAG